jgi:tRNA(Ile)-lysidine synthase
VPAGPHGATGALLARCTFPPAGAPLDCAVSGGPDSMALLVLAVAAGCDVTAHHVDHGLRPGSAAEAGVVASAASRFGARFVPHRVVVAPGPNLEARARAARRAVLPAGAATGHTADDQAETVLLNLLRGAGLDGLSGMRPGPAKPLLALRRSETAALCEAAGLVPVQDPSNADPVHLRNRVRAELLPRLADLAGRDLVPVLARQAALLRDEADLLDVLAGAVDPTDGKALSVAPPALARRAVRRLLAGEHPPGAAAVERVLAVARLEAEACEVEGGRRVHRSANRLSIGSQPEAPRRAR